MLCVSSELLDAGVTVQMSYHIQKGQLISKVYYSADDHVVDFIFIIARGWRTDLTRLTDTRSWPLNED